jgi:acetolactate synthase-1/2/3 large subunit
MTRMTGGQALVKALRRHGVDTIFALPGVQNDHLFNALHDEGNSVRVVHTRHEQGVAYMAYGYAKSTGRAGVYAVVPGPGLLNTTAALSTAYAGNAPVLCVAGQIRSDLIGRGVGQLHELPDQFAILRGLTKWAGQIDNPAKAEPVVAEAFRQMMSGRQRPAAVEIPTDVLAASAEVDENPKVEPLPLPQAPDPGAIEEAARILGRAECPLIMIGGGAMDAGAELLAVSDLLQAPIATGQSGKGAVSDRSPFLVSQPIGHRLWAKADVVLAVGTRLANPQLVWGVDNALRIVRIDADPEEHARIKAPAVGIVADARLALAALAQALPAHNRKRESRLKEVTALKEDFAKTVAEKLAPQKAWLDAIRAELPEDGIFVDELTQVGYCARFAFPVYQPRTYITSGYQGTLGYGFATALGVQVANPGRKVLSISGDGGFMYNVQELATAVLHQIPVVVVVFADGAFGNVRRMQKELYDGRVIASHLRNPDFVALARSFGARGVLARTPEELRREIRAGFEANVPTLIEVPMAEMPSPWPFIQLPRVRPVQA